MNNFNGTLTGATLKKAGEEVCKWLNERRSPDEVPESRLQAELSGVPVAGVPGDAEKGGGGKEGAPSSYCRRRTYL